MEYERDSHAAEQRRKKLRKYVGIAALSFMACSALLLVESAVTGSSSDANSPQTTGQTDITYASRQNTASAEAQPDSSFTFADGLVAGGTLAVAVAVVAILYVEHTNIGIDVRKKPSGPEYESFPNQIISPAENDEFNKIAWRISNGH